MATVRFGAMESLGGGDESALDGAEPDDQLKGRLDLVCSALQLDTAVANKAWRDFVDARFTFTLEGSPMQWIGCALYATHKKSCMRTVDKSGSVLKRNRINLSKLLNLCNIKLTEFFRKIKSWMDMVVPSIEFREFVSKLERNFVVCTELFHKYKLVYNHLFIAPDEISNTTNKNNKKLKLLTCNSQLLYEFCWCLFICVKTGLSQQSDDFVQMCHVLFSCMDIMFANVYVASHTDVINPKFLPHVPKHQAIPCIIPLLCKEFDVSSLDVTYIKEYDWKLIIQKFFDKDVLVGHSKTFMDMLVNNKFSLNLKSLNNYYETYILSNGINDERIFISGVNGDEVSNITPIVGTNSLPPYVSHTPLTGRKYLNSRNDVLSPASMVERLTNNLIDYLMGYSNVPSSALYDIFQLCRENPCQNIVKREKKMAATFLMVYAPLSSEEIAGNCLNLIEALYYRLLEQIIKDEQMKKPDIDLQRLLDHEIFHQTLFACATEIVLITCDQRSIHFPWVLEVFNIQPLHFYKIIELVVLVVKEKLLRDVVKHLNTIEEQILQSLVWTSDSPIWERIQSLNSSIPKYGDVCIQDTNESSSLNQSNDAQFNVIESLPSISGLHVSPVPSASCFLSTPNIDDTSNKKSEDFSIKPGQSLLSQTVITSKTVSQDKQNEQSSDNANKSPLMKTPGKAGSLGIFLRKFYKLAYIRLKYLYNKLDISKHVCLLEKMWTCFEYVIVNLTYLMRDRHLDQILMCIVYAICKVFTSEYDGLFVSIMRCYHSQPQALSDVYRSVLMPNDENEEPGPSQTVGKTEKCEDLIAFYNKVFVKAIQPFMKEFQSNGQQNQEYPMSTLPLLRASLNIQVTRVSISPNINIYSMPESLLLKNNEIYSSHLTYCFNRSNSQTLGEINAEMSERKRKRNHVETKSKRLCFDNSVDSESNKEENSHD